MRVFVHEYVTAEARTDASPALAAEGRAMLEAVLADLACCPGVEVVAAESGERDAFSARAKSADFTLAIAPEFDAILESRCRWVEEAGGIMLGSGTDAVRLAADKLLLADHLAAVGVPTPAVLRSRELFPAVLKPRFGAGSQATFLVRNPDELADARVAARTEGWEGELLLFPFVLGQAVSVAMMRWGERQLVLPAAAQHLSGDGRFRYLGGRVPLDPPLDRRAERLARRAADAVPGLGGYFGVDLVLGDDERGDSVIEINPRLTTSYVGLRVLARFNLMEALLALATGRPLPPIVWHGGPVAFKADGRVI